VHDTSSYGLWSLVIVDSADWERSAARIARFLPAFGNHGDADTPARVHHA
jgi:hypothetical protein